MHTLDFIVQPRLDPDVSLAEDAHFLHAVRRQSYTRSGLLRVYDFPGEVLSLGRYHLVPDTDGTSQRPRCHRRFSGGRAVPFGEGFVALALVLPHRSALLSSDPLALDAHQVLNRYVRGILEACRLADRAAFYPGRDFITAGRRLLGLVSFEVDCRGAILFEAVLAVRRDFSVLPALLEAADRSGVIKAEMVLPDDATCLERELGARLSTQEVAELLRRGYEKQFSLTLEPRTLTALERQAISATAAHEFRDQRWLRQRRLRPSLRRHAWTRVQLGTFEVFFELEQERFIKDIMFAGDFIANAAAVEQLERELRLCAAERPAIDAVVSHIFAEPQNYVLGIGGERTITETICRGIEA